MKLSIAAITATAILCFSCVPKGAESPERATTRAIVLTVAKAVAVADKACADYALQTKDAAVAKGCSAAYDLARPSLLGAESVLDSWHDGSKGSLACVSVDAVVALEQFARVFIGQKLALPPTLVDALELAKTFKRTCEGV